MQGGIIQTALEVIKMKEKQGDKAMDRLHDGMKTQMELNQSQGSWTEGSNSSTKVIKEKETVKETAKEPEKEEEHPASTATPATEAPGADDDEEKKGVADMGIMELASTASK